jgi:hypothetical protein
VEAPQGVELTDTNRPCGLTAMHFQTAERSTTEMLAEDAFGFDIASRLRPAEV